MRTWPRINEGRWQTWLESRSQGPGSSRNAIVNFTIPSRMSCQLNKRGLAGGLPASSLLAHAPLRMHLLQGSGSAVWMASQPLDLPVGLELGELLPISS